MDRKPKDLGDALADCQNQVEQLKRENKLLRDASRTFGALAERLNATLDSERRQGADRRGRPRGAQERRTPDSTANRSRR